MCTCTQCMHLWRTYNWILRAPTYQRIIIHQSFLMVYIFHWLTNSWEADNCSAGQDILQIYCKVNVHYHVPKSLPLVPVLIKINLVHKPVFLISILILSSHLCQGILNGVFMFFYQNFVCISFLSYACRIFCPSHSPHLFTLIICHEAPCAISSSLLLSISLYLICSCFNICMKMWYHFYFLVNNFCLKYLPALYIVEEYMFRDL